MRGVHRWAGEALAVRAQTKKLAVGSQAAWTKAPCMAVHAAEAKNPAWPQRNAIRGELEVNWRSTRGELQRN